MWADVLGDGKVETGEVYQRGRGLDRRGGTCHKRRRPAGEVEGVDVTKG